MAKENTIKERESKTDIAYRLLSKKKKERGFYELWEDVKNELAKVREPEELENIDDDISFFYTNLTLDGRFVNVGDNKWNLRERVTFDKVDIDMSDIYMDEEEESDEEEEENDEYVTDDYDEPFDDSTGSDADINQFREQKQIDDDEEL